MSQLPPPPPLLPNQPTFRPGPVGRRIVARLLDLLLIGLIDMLLLRPRFAEGPLIPDGSLTELERLPASYTLLSAVLALTYFAAFESRTGSTPGKRALSLRVYGPQGALPSFGSAVRRSLFAVAGVVSVIPLVGEGLATPLNLLAVITVLLTIQRSQSRQGWHDQFAGGTQVVHLK